ncbi:MAG: hypothetical protein AAFX05_05560, partial [Planctomycetota bacterium]
MALWLAILGVLLLVTYGCYRHARYGVRTLRRRWSRQEGDAPWCTACFYELTGLGPEHPHCPECG